MNIYTDIDKAPKNYAWITDIDAYFDALYFKFSFDKEDLQFIKRIEKAELYDREKFKFINRYGTFYIENISTGTKALLIIRELARKKETNKGMDVTECGPNVLDFIFDVASDAKIPLILKHVDVSSLRDRQITIDDEVTVRKTKNFFDALFTRLNR